MEPTPACKKMCVGGAAICPSASSAMVRYPCMIHSGTCVYPRPGRVLHQHAARRPLLPVTPPDARSRRNCNPPPSPLPRARVCSPRGFRPCLGACAPPRGSPAPAPSRPRRGRGCRPWRGEKHGVSQRRAGGLALERREGRLLRPQPQPRGDVPGDGIGTAQHLEGVQPKAPRFVLDQQAFQPPFAPPARKVPPAAWARTEESCCGRRAPDAPVRPSARGK